MYISDHMVLGKCYEGVKDENSVTDLFLSQLSALATCIKYSI